MGENRDSLSELCGGKDPGEMIDHLDDLFNAFILSDEFLGATQREYKIDVLHTVDILKKALAAMDKPKLSPIENELRKAI